MYYCFETSEGKGIPTDFFQTINFIDKKTICLKHLKPLKLDAKRFLKFGRKDYYRSQHFKSIVL